MAVETTFSRSQGNGALDWLEEFVGGPAVAKLGDRHPLTIALRARERRSNGGMLTLAQERAVALVEGAALALRRHEGDWTDHTDDLRKLLTSEGDLGAIIFELEVGDYLESAAPRTYRWSRFEEGAPDWVDDGGGVGVECHRAMSTTKLTDYGKTLSTKAKQHQNWTGALVIALGFNGTASAEQAQSMHKEAKRHLPWMTRHREVSAVLIFGSQRAGKRRTTASGIPGLEFRAAQVIEIRNHNAFRPIPPGQLGDGPELSRRTFPSAMQSLTQPVIPAPTPR
ncbi:MAG: hypothetical protein FIB00_13630, partial [Chloroflexi bacterium]|nr:hypothetical protein [Chloroflexota bacterium]